MKKELLAVVLAGMFSLTAAGENLVIDGVAAHANEKNITVGDVIVAMHPLRQQLMSSYGGEELKIKLKEIYKDTLNVLIEQMLILDLFEKEKMNLPEWVVDERVDEVIKDSFGGDKASLLVALSRERISFEEWHGHIRDQIIVSLMRGEYVTKNAVVSPAFVWKAYEKDKEKYCVPEKVRVRIILIPADRTGQAAESNRIQAEDVRKRAAAGENFAELARKYSKGLKAADGGDWGWVEPKMLPPEIERVTADLTPMEVSRVVEIRDGFCVVKLEGRSEERMLSFVEAHDEIERDLMVKESKRIYEAWVTGLKQDAYIKIFENDLF